MTTFVTHAPVACTAVLLIDAMPRKLRPDVEELMVRCIPSAPELEIPGIDPLEATWCTRWERSILPGTIGTRQVITGTAEELELFMRELTQLRQRYEFDVSMRLVD